MSEEYYILNKLKEAINNCRANVDEFGRYALSCPHYEDQYCLAHNITTSCNIVDCPLNDME